MRKVRFNCQSCETKTDIIVWEANIPEEEVEIKFCPICSSSKEDFEIYSMFDDLDDE